MCLISCMKRKLWVDGDTGWGGVYHCSILKVVWPELKNDRLSSGNSVFKTSRFLYLHVTKQIFCVYYYAVFQHLAVQNLMTKKDVRNQKLIAHLPGQILNPIKCFPWSALSSGTTFITSRFMMTYGRKGWLSACSSTAPKQIKKAQTDSNACMLLTSFYFDCINTVNEPRKAEIDLLRIQKRCVFLKTESVDRFRSKLLHW